MVRYSGVRIADTVRVRLVPVEKKGFVETRYICIANAVVQIGHRCQGLGIFPAQGYVYEQIRMKPTWNQNETRMKPEWNQSGTRIKPE